MSNYNSTNYPKSSQNDNAKIIKIFKVCIFLYNKGKSLYILDSNNTFSCQLSVISKAFTNKTDCQVVVTSGHFSLLPVTRQDVHQAGNKDR